MSGLFSIGRRDFSAGSVHSPGYSAFPVSDVSDRAFRAASIGMLQKAGSDYPAGISSLGIVQGAGSVFDRADELFRRNGQRLVEPVLQVGPDNPAFFAGLPVDSPLSGEYNDGR